MNQNEAMSVLPQGGLARHAGVALKVWAGPAIMLTLFLLFVGVTLVGVNRSSALVQGFFDQTLAQAQAVSDARQALFRTQVGAFSGVAQVRLDAQAADRIEADFKVLLADLDEQLERLKGLTQRQDVAAEVQSGVQQALTQATQYRKAIADGVDMSLGDPNGGTMLMRTADAAFGKVLTEFGALDAQLSEQVDATRLGLLQRFERDQWLLAAVSLAFLLIGLVASSLATRAILRPLRGLIDALQRCGQGHLGARLRVDGRDELAAAALAFNTTMAALSELIDQLRQQSTQVESSTQRISTEMQRLASDVDAQNDSIMQTVAAVEQLSASAQQIAQTSQQTRDLFDATASHAREATECVEQSATEVDAAALAVNELASLIASLEQRTGSIGNAVRIIQEIADQTNLLALNAAIEAARAGDQGRGFAVVADEVRKLAERTRSSTIEIDGLIRGVIRETDVAADKMHRCVQTISEGVSGSRAAAQQMRDVQAAIEQSKHRFEQVFASTQEQTCALEQVSSSIERISRTADQTLGVARGSSEQTLSMADGVRRLMQHFSRFSLT